MQFGNWDVEVDEEISYEAFLSGKAFFNPAAARPALPAAPSMAAAAAPRPPLASATNTANGSKPAFRPPGRAGALQSSAATTNAARTAAEVDKSVPAEAHVLHEATATSAPVYIDSFLARSLRPHQKEGVKFLVDVRSWHNWYTLVMETLARKYWLA